MCEIQSLSPHTENCSLEKNNHNLLCNLLCNVYYNSLENTLFSKLLYPLSVSSFKLSLVVLIKLGKYFKRHIY